MTHPNDMVHWDEIGCQRGCEEHKTRMTTVHLAQPHGYRDLTAIPQRFARSIGIEIWDAEATPVDGGAYCPARDAVSETILSHRIWEPAETTVILLCLEQFGRVTFVDIGCQIGWFAMLAADIGADVVAIDADPDCVALAGRNVDRYAGRDQHVSVFQLRVDATTSPLWVGHDIGSLDSNPVVAKIDIEGGEADAVKMLDEMIRAGLVRYMLIEISPVFNDSYLDLARDLIRRGYEAYEIPSKQMPPHQIDQLADLRPFHLDKQAISEIPTWHQKNVLFALGGL